LNLRFVDSFEAALEEMDTWSPHLLLLDYTSGAMPYETFVHVRLPLVDPYRSTGSLMDNPWQHKASPILMVAGEPMASTPGLRTPHLNRAAYFVPKPVEPSCLLPLVDKLLPEPNPGIVLDPDHGWVEVQGCQHTVSEQGMDLLVTLARHHPRPLTAARLAQRLHEERGIRISESAVRMTVSALRRQLTEDDPQSLGPVDISGQRGFAANGARPRT
jgi:DNA-binding response OmpR family regulator